MGGGGVGGWGCRLLVYGISSTRVWRRWWRLVVYSFHIHPLPCACNISRSNGELTLVGMELNCSSTTWVEESMKKLLVEKGWMKKQRWVEQKLREKSGVELIHLLCNATLCRALPSWNQQFPLFVHSSQTRETAKRLRWRAANYLNKDNKLNKPCSSLSPIHCYQLCFFFISSRVQNCLCQNSKHSTLSTVLSSTARGAFNEWYGMVWLLDCMFALPYSAVLEETVWEIVHTC